jgi:hypothetical protein
MFWFEGTRTVTQDGAMSHFRADVRDFLDLKFTGQWIAQATPVS